MMRCNTCRKQRILYEEGTLPPARRAALEKHLTRCPRCREAFRAEQRLRTLLGAAQETGARHDLWPAVAARIRAGQPCSPPLVTRLWRPALALATAVAALGLAVTLLGPPQRAADAGAWIESMVGPPTVARLVYEDPWAGEVARALDLALSGEA